MSKLTDNKFWYIGYTSAEMGDKDLDKCFCLIVRNPFDRSWKKWAAIRAKHEEIRDSIPDRERQEAKAWVNAAIKRYNIPVGVDEDKAHLFDDDVPILEDK